MREAEEEKETRHQKNRRNEERRRQRTDIRDEEREGEQRDSPLSEVLEFVRGLSAGKYDVSHLLTRRG